MSIRRVAFCAALLAATMMAGCYYYPAVPAAPSGPSTFERAWNAALGAAEDVGVSVSTADRTSGTIYGTSDSQNVTIRCYTQADGRVRVEFHAEGGAPGAEPGLATRLSDAYERRMGR